MKNDKMYVSSIKKVWDALRRKAGMRTRFTDFANQQIRRENLKRDKDYFEFVDSLKKSFYFTEDAYNLIVDKYEERYHIQLPEFTPDYVVNKPVEEDVVEDYEYRNPLGMIAEEFELDKHELLDCFATVYGTLRGKDEIDYLCSWIIFDNRTQNFVTKSLFDVDWDEDTYAVEFLLTHICVNRDMFVLLLDEYTEYEEIIPSQVADMLDEWDRWIIETNE